jgi:hypothetical protein
VTIATPNLDRVRRTHNLSGQALYEEYLAFRGWATVRPWINLDLHRQRAWTAAAENITRLGIPSSEALRTFDVLLQAVSLAP